jgi:hypothetical protein
VKRCDTHRRRPSFAVLAAFAALAGAATPSRLRRPRRGNKYAPPAPADWTPPEPKQPREPSAVDDSAETMRRANRAYNATAPGYRKRTTNPKKLRRAARKALTERSVRP